MFFGGVKCFFFTVIFKVWVILPIVARLMATPVNLDDFLAEVKGVGFHLDSNVKSPLLYLGYSRNAITNLGIL